MQREDSGVVPALSALGIGGQEHYQRCPQRPPPSLLVLLATQGNSEGGF